MRKKSFGAVLENSATLEGGAVFFLNNHVPHNKKGAEIAPLGAPNYGQPNSTHRDAVLAPFFSECSLHKKYAPKHRREPYHVTLRTMSSQKQLSAEFITSYVNYRYP